ncbi:NAD-dependent epimerase/dehydratase family protein [Bombilactobacillus thymidiniphilus]|uniref:NAD-dependent epimerase/dehydratase family protein n=1 Tax=Bombilactobacillus thymidiniphilus TaxID=2923363 RepID=A0ABY4PER4_9LACO|nr:NAD-dependent epimerase/dehydratase family protein [Bombilactobacillus thymidiniphilus]UQS84236.1 NAD-dependent epimerase/dehydratase family protein [Bombilactobacillus thymidiniphilus]
MQIAIMGGSGYVGQALLAKLVMIPNYDVVSLSRSGGDKVQQLWKKQVTFIKTDFVHDQNWQSAIQSADWVIDLVGILHEHTRQQITYYNASFLPAQKVIDYLAEHHSSAKFVFMAANWVPRSMNKYLFYKEKVIIYARKKLPQQTIVLYPNLIYDRKRKSSWLLAQLLKVINRFSNVRLYPDQLTKLTDEIVQIIAGKPSYLTAKR